MNQEQHTSSELSKAPISLSFDDFELSAESFKPVNKGLGFHQDQKKPTFKTSSLNKVEKVNNNIPLTNMLRSNEMKIKNQVPTGLEAFYGIPPVPPLEDHILTSEVNIAKAPTILKDAAPTEQLSAWLIDLVMITAAVILTGVLLVMASGITFNLILKLVTQADLVIFTSSLFAIYYMLYFTILDLSNTPGKTIFGIRLVTTDESALSVKHTFARTLVSLLSIMVFCLPMVLDFQGRLSDTKIVK